MTTFIQTSHGSYITQQQQQQPTSPPNLVNSISSASSINPQTIYTSSSGSSSSSVAAPSSSSSSSSSASNSTTSNTSLTALSSTSLPPSSGLPSVSSVTSFSLPNSSSTQQHQHLQQQQQQQQGSHVTYSSSSLSSCSSAGYAVQSSSPSISCLTSSSHLTPSSSGSVAVTVTGSSSGSGTGSSSSSVHHPASVSSGPQLIHSQNSFLPGSGPTTTTTTLLSNQAGSLVLSPRNVSGLPSYSTSNPSTAATAIMLPLQGNGGSSTSGPGTVNDQLIGNQLLSSIQSSQQIVSPMVPLLLANGQLIPTGLPSQGAFSLSQANSTTATSSVTTSTSNSQQAHQQQYQFGNFIGTSLATSLPTHPSTQIVTNGSGQIFAISPSLINNLNQQQSSAAAINSLQSHQSSSAYIQVVTPNGIALVSANQIISDQPLMSTINNNNQMDNSSVQHQQLLQQQHHAHQQSHHGNSSGVPERERPNKRVSQKSFYSRNDNSSGSHSGPSHSRMLKKSALAQAQLQQLQLQQQQQQQQHINQAIQVSISSGASTSSSSTTTSNTKNSGRMSNPSSHGFPLGASSLASLSCYNRSNDLKSLNNSGNTNCQPMYLGNQANNTVSNSVDSPSPPLSTASSMDPDSGNQATVAQTINNSYEAVVDGVNLEEVKEFARQFKLRRLSLGLTQTQVGQALSATAGPSYSQSAICRFEKLDITPKSASKIKPVLEKWMHDLEIRCRQGNTDPASFTGNPNSKKRKRRTSFSPAALEVLNAFFEKNTHPSSSEMTELADKLQYDREVVRVWFCNKRQVLRNNVKKSEPPLSLLTLTSRAAKAKAAAAAASGTSSSAPSTSASSLAVNNTNSSKNNNNNNSNNNNNNSSNTTTNNNNSNNHLM